MGRCLGAAILIIGLLFIGAAIVEIIMFTSDSGPIHEYLEEQHCRAGETLQTGSRQTVDGSTTTFFCVRGTSLREITDDVMPLGIGVFVGLLVAGILFVIAGAILLARKRRTTAAMPYMMMGGTPQPMQVTFTQDSYSAAEVEQKLAQMRQLVQNGVMTQEQYAEIEMQLRLRQR